jgi:hypothetical protein
MLKSTLMESCNGYIFRRFEHPTRGAVVTLTYPCGRVVYVARGLEPAVASTRSSAEMCGSDRSRKSFRRDDR